MGGGLLPLERHRVGGDPQEWHPPLIPLLFWFLFILWILYLISGKDPEIKSKLKIIVLIAYFVPMILIIPNILFNYYEDNEYSNRPGWRDDINYFEAALDAVLLCGLWPVFWADEFFRYPSSIVLYTKKGSAGN